MQTISSWGLAHSYIHRRLTSPQGNRLLNSIPVIGVPVGGSRMLESIINHSTLRGRFCISLYSSSNMSRNISSLCTWQITTMNLHNEENFTCVAQEMRNELYIIHKHNHTLNAVFLCFSDHASWIDCIIITNLMYWLLFIHKILFSSTCFEAQVLIFRTIQLYTCSIWYCHSLWEILVACQYIAWVRTQAVYRQATRNSYREWQYHMLHVYNCILLKMSTWGSKHVEENSILWINNNQCIKLVINI